MNQNYLESLYSQFDEDKRLVASFSRTIEFKTTMNVLQEYLRDSDAILDVGAATGVYSLPLANLGHRVDAVEIVKKHVDQLEEKRRLHHLSTLSVYHQSAVDMSNLVENAYDVGLCFGPLYHLNDVKDQIAVIEQMKRLVKPDGIIMLAFINNDFVITTETQYTQGRFLVENSYNHSTFKVNDEPFVFHTLNQVKQLVETCGLQMLDFVATDGLSELMSNTLDAMTIPMQNQWFNYHLHTCRKPEFLGASNHWLVVVKSNH